MGLEKQMWESACKEGRFDYRSCPPYLQPLQSVPNPCPPTTIRRMLWTDRQIYLVSPATCFRYSTFSSVTCLSNSADWRKAFWTMSFFIVSTVGVQLCSRDFNHSSIATKLGSGCCEKEVKISKWQTKQFMYMTLSNHNTGFKITLRFAGFKVFI